MEARQSVNGLIVIPDYSFSNHPKIDIFDYPGRREGTKAGDKEEKVMEWIESDTGIGRCNGHSLFGAKGTPAVLGLLDGSGGHDSPLGHRRRAGQPATGVTIDHTKRFVDNGKIMTSGGISAGIDLSLHIVKKLCGEETANKTMEYMEYGEAAPKNH